MKFKHYNPEQLIPIFQEIGITSSYYIVCPGCILINDFPEDCIHYNKDMESPSIQAGLFCPHCHFTAEDSKTKFPLFVDENLDQKVAELEEIIKMCSD